MRLQNAPPAVSRQHRIHVTNRCIRCDWRPFYFLTAVLCPNLSAHIQHRYSLCSVVAAEREYDGKGVGTMLKVNFLGSLQPRAPNGVCPRVILTRLHQTRRESHLCESLARSIRGFVSVFPNLELLQSLSGLAGSSSWPIQGLMVKETILREQIRV